MSIGNITRGSYTNPGSDYFSRVWNGVDTVSPRPKIMPWNEYTVSVSSSHIQPGQGNIAWPPRWGEVSFGEIIPDFTSNDWLGHLSKVSDAVKGHSFNLGVALGESPESLKTIGTGLFRIARAIRYTRQGRVGDALRVFNHEAGRERFSSRRARRKAKGGVEYLDSRDASALWLELQYGWKPIVNDIYASAQAFETLTSPPRKTRLSVNAGKVERTVVQLFNSAVPTSGTTTIKHTLSRRVIVELVESLPAARTLGLQDPASIAWNLLPFSFIADWAIPIGTYLDALNTIPNINGKLLISTRYLLTGAGTGQRTGLQMWYPPYVSVDQQTLYPDTSFVNAFTTFKKVRYTRIVRTSAQVSIPKPQFELSEALNSNRIKNAIALIHQFTR